MKHKSPEDQLALAIFVAAGAHLDQRDKAGVPYILHPLKVMHYLKTDDYELMAIAVLHDIVEDTSITIKEMQENGLSPRVCRVVDLLTKKVGQSAEDYLKAIMSDPDAVSVKLSDLRHNSDIRRLKGLSEKDLLRLQKYHKMYTTLKSYKDFYGNIAKQTSGCPALD